MREDIVGKIYNNLVVLEYVGCKNKSAVYKCRCSCGNITFGSRIKIISGKKKSCGCLRKINKSIPDPLRKSLSRINDRIHKHKHFASTDVTLEFLWELYIQQGGKCYYTGLKLDLNEENEYAISVDRIDSDKSYLKDNIVLTCRYVNFFKNNLKIDDFIIMLNKIKEVDKKDIPYYNRLSVRKEI